MPSGSLKIKITKIVSSFRNAPLFSLQFWKEQTMEIWMASKILWNNSSYYKKVLEDFRYLSWAFLKNLLESVTNREIFTNSKINVKIVTKRSLQSVAGITKWDRKLLQRLTKTYWKVEQVIQSVTVNSTSDLRWVPDNYYFLKDFCYL